MNLPLPARWAVLALALAAAACAETAADARFEAVANGFIADDLRANPERATQLGDHRYDDRLTDYRPAALAEQDRRLHRALAAVRGIDAAQLTGPNRDDAEILELNLQREIFTLEEERPAATDPLTYDESLADSIYLLVARDVTPPAERLRGVAGRLRAIPEVVAEAEANLERPARVKTETAIQRMDGAIGLVRVDLEPLVRQVPGLRAEVDPLRERAAAAMESYRRWLQQVLLPRSDGSFRLGAARFRTKLRFALASSLSPEEIRTRALREIGRIDDRMYATAAPLYRRYWPKAAAEQLSDRPRVIKAVLDRLADNHASDRTVVPRAKEILAEATAFVRDHRLVTVPDAPINVIVAPVFMRGVSVAYCDPPGALEPRGQTFYAIAPAPAEWTAARKLSYYREYNDWMLHDLTAHEAMPGHYLQLAHANRFKAPTLVRAIFSSGSFIEGWAVYMEQVMADSGFGGPEERMEQLKMRLRATINALLDQGIHMGAMTEGEAMDLMMRQGFQEEGEAAGKWRRACLTSTQLSTYFVGFSEHDDMRAAAEAAWGPRFNLQRYHDAVISFGSPPVRMVRRELGL